MHFGHAAHARPVSASARPTPPVEPPQLEPVQVHAVQAPGLARAVPVAPLPLAPITRRSPRRALVLALCVGFAVGGIGGASVHSCATTTVSR